MGTSYENTLSEGRVEVGSTVSVLLVSNRLLLESSQHQELHAIGSGGSGSWEGVGVCYFLNLNT